MRCCGRKAAKEKQETPEEANVNTHNAELLAWLTRSKRPFTFMVLTC